MGECQSLPVELADAGSEPEMRFDIGQDLGSIIRFMIRAKRIAGDLVPSLALSKISKQGDRYLRDFLVTYQNSA